MPPRTGPRSRRRSKTGAPRHFAVIRLDHTVDLVVAHSLELDDGSLVLRDRNDAISQVVAKRQWREIRPARPADYSGYMADMALPAPPEESDERREQATNRAVSPVVTNGISATTLVNENDPVFQLTRKEEQDRRFVPSSPEEAQRILMELERRLAPDYQDPPDCESNAPPPPVAPRKD